MKKLHFISFLFLALMLGVGANLYAQDLGVDPVYGDWSGYTVIDADQWVNSGDSMVTTVTGLAPRLDPGNDDWQWWNYPYHCAELAVTGADMSGDIELEAMIKMPDSTTTGYWDVCLIFDYVDEYNYNMFTLWRGDGSTFYTVTNGIRAQVGDIAHKTFLEQATGINSFHKVRVLRIGDKVSAFFDDNPVISVTDAVLSGTGKLGVGTLNDSILVDEIRAWEPPIQFSADATWGNYGNYAFVNSGKVVVDTVVAEPVIYLKSISSPRLAPGNTDWQWWLYPYHLANIAYIPTQTYGDFTLEADLFKPVSENDDQNWDAALVFGMESENDYSVLWLFNRTNGTKLSTVKDGIREDLVFSPDSLFQDNDWHTFKVTRAGNLVTCYMDDVEFLSLDDAKLGTQGMVGLGSINDPANFDNVMVTGTATAVSDANELISTTYGTIIAKTIVDVFPLTGVTADMMVAGAEVSAGATAVVMNDTMGIVDGATDVDNGMYLSVIAENGVVNAFEIIMYELSGDNNISWFGLGDISPTNDSLTGLFEGTKVGTLSESIVVHDSATFVVTDADRVELADDVELVTGMLVTVTAEDGHSRDYLIIVKPAPWPVQSILQVDESNKPVIDEFFDDWADFEAVAIDAPHDDPERAPTSEADHSMHYKSVWDEDGLYMYFHWSDDIINFSAENNWERDGVEVAILVTDDPGKRSAYNAFWKAEERTWEQKYTLTYGMTSMEALQPNRDMTGSDFAWYDRDDGLGWELEVFWTWAALNGNGGLYEFVPGIGKKISVQIMSIDSDDEPVVQHTLFWWQHMGTNSNASEYAMFRLSSSTGVDQARDLNFGIYPNPANDILYFSGDEMIQSAQISNVVGQVVLRQEVRDNSINIGELDNGLYLLSIETVEGKMVTAKFIKK